MTSRRAPPPRPAPARAGRLPIPSLADGASLASTAFLGVLTLGACGGPSLPGECATIRFEPGADTADQPAAAAWLATPFPSDHRRTAGGTIDLSDFPNPLRKDLIDLYADHGTEVLDGFGTNSPIYLTFTEPVQPESLPDPEDPAASTRADAPVQLVDVTPGSPTYGQRWPLRWTLFEIEGTYVTPDMLAVAPAWGFPLRERTTYALLVTSAVRDRDGDPIGAAPALAELVGASAPPCAGLAEPPQSLMEPLRRSFAPLAAWLSTSGFDGSTLAGATVFTTQTITTELAELHRQVHEDLPAPTLDPARWVARGSSGEPYLEASFTYDAGGATASFWIMEGTFDSPNYQRGQVPYASAGGDFHRVDGHLTPDHTESLRFVLTIPTEPPRQGSCYPIVQYSHGTGGSARSWNRSQAGRHAALGLATIGVDQPLHGTRWGGSSNTSLLELYSFNFLNPTAARTLFRQAAVDTFSLTRFVREALHVPASHSPTEAEICFDADRMAYFGHSQGGITGALAAAFERGIGAWIFSGAGGGLSITVVERKDGIDIEATLALLLEPAPDERLTEMHPITALIQMLSEVTDPINYAPRWLGDAVDDDVPPPIHVMATSGTEDAQTPYLTAAALALAARIPTVEPVAAQLPGHAVAGLDPVAAPVEANVRDRTAGFLQWSEATTLPGVADHFVIFTWPEAIGASMGFLDAYAWSDDGIPVIERDPAATWR